MSPEAKCFLISEKAVDLGMFCEIIIMLILRVHIEKFASCANSTKNREKKRKKKFFCNCEHTKRNGIRFSFTLEQFSLFSLILFPSQLIH